MLLRSDREWSRVIGTEIMQLSGGNVFVNLGFLKKTSRKHLIILTRKIHLHCIIFTFYFFAVMAITGKVRVNFTEFWLVQFDVPTH